MATSLSTTTTYFVSADGTDTDSYFNLSTLATPP